MPVRQMVIPPVNCFFGVDLDSLPDQFLLSQFKHPVMAVSDKAFGGTWQRVLFMEVFHPGQRMGRGEKQQGFIQINDNAIEYIYRRQIPGNQIVQIHR